MNFYIRRTGMFVLLIAVRLFLSGCAHDLADEINKNNNINNVITDNSY